MRRPLAAVRMGLPWLCMTHFMWAAGLAVVSASAFADHGEELVLVNYGDAEGLGFLAFGRPHVLACKHIIGLFSR